MHSHGKEKWDLQNEMTNQISSFSSPASHPQQSQDSPPHISQYLKVTPELKTGTIPGSAVANAVALSLKMP